MTTAAVRKTTEWDRGWKRHSRSIPRTLCPDMTSAVDWALNIKRLPKIGFTVLKCLCLCTVVLIRRRLEEKKKSVFHFLSRARVFYIVVVFSTAGDTKTV